MDPESYSDAGFRKHLNGETNDTHEQKSNGDDENCRISDDEKGIRHSFADPISEEERQNSETGISRNPADPRVLEAVQLYTERIKSFLGWDNRSELSSPGCFLNDGVEKVNISGPVGSESPGENNKIRENNGSKALLSDKTTFGGNEDNELDHGLDTGNKTIAKPLDENNETTFLEKKSDVSVCSKVNDNSENNSIIATEFEKDNFYSPHLAYLKEIPEEDMDKCLMREHSPFSEGLILSDEEDILKNEIKQSDLNEKSITENHFSSAENAEDQDSATREHDSDINNDNPEKNDATECKFKGTREMITHYSECTPENMTLQEDNEEDDENKVKKLSVEVVNFVLKRATDQIQDNLLSQIYPSSKEFNSENNFTKDSRETNDENVCNNKNLLKDNEQKNICTLLTQNAGADDDYRTLNDDAILETSVTEKNIYNNDALKENFILTQKPKNVDDAEKTGIHDFDEETICGMGSFRPDWIQPWATARMYLILYSIIGVLQGSYYTYLIGILSTLEKRFAFKSKISGIIMMVDEITPLLLGVLIGYFGGKGHRPRMVALGMLLSAICCFISALPYFIYGPAQHLTSITVQNETGPELCDSEMKKESCDIDDRPPTLAAILFLMLGSFLKGFGNLAYYAVGLAYMDDNAEKKNTPMYFAVAFALRMLGPLVGFLMSSAFLKYYENPFADPGFGPDDPRWIGGWWMGFCLQGILLLIFTIPISLFPRRLPSHPKPRCKDDNKEESLQSKVSGLFTALKRLAKNPLYILLVVNTILAIFGGFGYYTMLPKYMENQFRLSASDASLFSGPPGLAAIMVSTVFGGFLIWKYRPSAKLLLAGMVLTEVTIVFGYLLLMVPGCDNVQMSNTGMDDRGLILENNCNFNCNCSTAAFTPVCGPDGKTTYFSPCYAGCSVKHSFQLPSEEHQVFENCLCAADPSVSNNRTVVEGFCEDDKCWAQALIYITLLPILQTITSILRVSHTMILLRSIHPEDKSVALGTFEALICLFGFIPFPITFGALVDSACLVWEKSCGQIGNCWFYDMEKFKKLIHGTSSLFSALSAMCLLAIYFLNARVRSLYDEDDDDEAPANKTTTDVLKLDTIANEYSSI